MKDDPRVAVNIVSSRMLHKLDTLVVLVEAGKSNNLLWTVTTIQLLVKSNCKVISLLCPRRFDLRTRLVRSNLNILRFDSWRKIFLKLQ